MRMGGCRQNIIAGAMLDSTAALQKKTNLGTTAIDFEDYTYLRSCFLQLLQLVQYGTDIHGATGKICVSLNV